MLILCLQNNITCARSFEASFIQKLYLSLALVTLKIRARKNFFMRARKKSTRTKIYLLVTKETIVKKTDRTLNLVLISNCIKSINLG